MNVVNLWIALSSAAKTAVNTRLNWNEEKDGVYSGPVGDKEARIFRAMADMTIVQNMQNMFRAGTFAGKTWTLYSVYPESSMKAKQAVDWLAANRTNVFKVVGAWHWDGRQVGADWEVVEGERTGNITGTPLYPIPTAQLLKIMPTIKVYAEDGSHAETEPTELSDTNLLLGQAPRVFV